MQFYDFFTDLVSYVPERYTALQNFINGILPLVLMACALLTAFFGLKCVKWWCALTFFFLGTALPARFLIKNVNLTSLDFWMLVGVCLSVGVLGAFFSKYLARGQMIVSEFLIIYAALPTQFFYLKEIPAKAVSVVLALAMCFLTVKYKYLIIIPTTSFSGSFIFWNVALRYISFGNETLNGIVMGVVALAFQCLISRKQIKETYEDIIEKYKITKAEGKRAVHFVKRKIHTQGVNIKNIRIKGAKNVRDLGGLPVEGGVIKPKMLLRSSHLSFINDKGATRLINEYGLKTVIDLRNSLEKDEKPDVPINGVKFLEMPVFDNTIPGLSHEDKQNLDNVPLMTDLYAAVMNGDSVINLCAVVRKIILATDDKYSILYHCTEGKDRTGMVTALLLLILGADRDVILEDYLYSNKMSRKKAIVYFILVTTIKHNKFAAHRVYNVFLAREEYINEVFKFVDKVGLDSFINDYLKLVPDDIENFKNRLIDKK